MSGVSFFKVNYGSGQSPKFGSQSRDIGAQQVSEFWINKLGIKGNAVVRAYFNENTGELREWRVSKYEESGREYWGEGGTPQEAYENMIKQIEQAKE